MAFDNIHQKTISCRIPANIKARLDEICGEKCKTIGELMRDMIRTTYPEPKQPAIQAPIKTTTGTPIPITKEEAIKTTTKKPHQTIVTVGKKKFTVSAIMAKAKESEDYKELATKLGLKDAFDLYEAIKGQTKLSPETVLFKKGAK